MRGPALIASLLAWAGAWIFWYSTTRSLQPTDRLAAIVTTCLILAYAAEAYLNHLVLIPRYLRPGRYRVYISSLVPSMMGLTAVALAVIRTSFASLHGPDADPNGLYKHFAIDLVGMAVHLMIASIVVWIYGRVQRGLRGGIDRGPEG